MSRHTETVPLSAFAGLGEHEIDLTGHDDGLPVTFDWSPGHEPSGMSGPPEHYDPGSPDEFVIVEPADMSLNADCAITEWLDSNWERPDDGPDPDDWRDRMIDDRLTGDA